VKILVVPGNVHTAKSYPHWPQLLKLLEGHEVRKILGELPLSEIIEAVNWCDVWVSIDSFLQHLVAYYKLKPGVVIWSKSNPAIFGYSTNINLLKDRKYLKPQQFKWWRDEPDDLDAFVAPEIIVQEIERIKEDKHGVVATQ
jgi:ADP-heptose:LPS heptosyltransferase